MIITDIYGSGKKTITKSLKFFKIGQFVYGCADETGPRQINLKLDCPVENRAVENATFTFVQDLQDY